MDSKTATWAEAEAKLGGLSNGPAQYNEIADAVGSRGGVGLGDKYVSRHLSGWCGDRRLRNVVLGARKR